MTKPAKHRARPQAQNAPRAVTATYLRNAAMHYLSQRAASVAMLRDTLVRRAKRRLLVKVLDQDTKLLIEKQILDLQSLGLVDDARFADVRARTLAGRGLSKKRIALGLKMKGVTASTIATTSAADVDELEQARRYVQRKRLGPHRRGDPGADTRRKDLASLARAGFSYAIAVRALDPGDSDDA